MLLGQKILNLRKQKNLSQEQLAEKIGVTRQTISKWELNDSCPDLMQAKELANFFDVTLDELSGHHQMSKGKFGFKKLFFIITYILFALSFFASVISYVVSYTSIEGEVITNLYCSLNEKEYHLRILSDIDSNEIEAVDGDDYFFDKVEKFNIYEYSDEMIEAVREHFKANGGNCN